jgi:glycerophosphoryl diester phosphodiesterase
VARLATASQRWPFPTLDGTAPKVIGHRGASGYRPEHTLAAYELAIAQGADLIEPDLVITRDGVLIARHENELSLTTDVASRPQFAARRRSQRIDGREVAGWFSEDFTLDEIRSLRATERFARERPENARLDGQLGLVTLDEILALVGRTNSAGTRVVGVYPELKYASHFASIGLAVEPRLADALHAAGLPGKAPVFV